MSGELSGATLEFPGVALCVVCVILHCPFSGADGDQAALHVGAGAFWWHL